MSGADTGPAALSKAHALSAEAHALLDGPSSTLPKLRLALTKYQLALSIYEATAHAKAGQNGAGGAGIVGGGGGGTDKTLDLLVSQHRRLVRDVERKIDAAERAEASAAAQAAGSIGKARNGAGGGDGVEAATIQDAGLSRRLARTSTEPSVPPPNGDTATARKASYNSHLGTGPSSASAGAASAAVKGTSPVGIGLASLAHPPPPTRPGFMASRTSLTPSRGLPPFARPPATSVPSPTAMQYVAAAPTSTAPRNLSPLYSLHSSTSSSEPGELESFISVGPSGLTRTVRAGREGIEQDQDPFNRFWAMLDGALDNISRPVAFASAPIGREGVDVEGLREGLGSMGLGGGVHARETGDEDASAHSKSPSDSFYLIPHHPPSSSDTSPNCTAKSSGKTPEELALENKHLRASLDALAIHTNSVEKENAALKRGIKGREVLLRSVVGEVRQEAEKARIDQSILASQHLPPPPSRHPFPAARIRHNSSTSITPAVPAQTTLATHGVTVASTTAHATLQMTANGTADTRVAQLEAQLATLRSENEKQAAQITKYKDRFERIKANARAKRDAAARDG